MTDAEVLEAQLIELSIVGKSFLCLYATSARCLYVSDVPGLPKLLDTTECRRPVQWNAVADSRFGTRVIRHRTYHALTTGAHRVDFDELWIALRHSPRTREWFRMARKMEWVSYLLSVRQWSS